MKKSNLLHATLYGMLCAFLAVLSMFYLPTSFGLILTFFATISATLCVTELGVPIRSYLLWAVALHFAYLFLIIAMSEINVVSYKIAVLFGAITSLFVLFSGLTIAVVKAKKFKNNNAMICIFVFGISFIIASCNQKQPKQFCSELSQECELQKDFVMIKILQNNGNGVDAYGTPLLANEWYLHSTKSGAVLPLEWNGMESSNVTPPELEKVLSGEKSYSTLYKIKKYKVDTLENFGLRQRGGGGGIAQVITKAVLLETDGYFEVFNNGRGKYVGFRSQKETAENPVTE